jgi:hypothetical protein
LVERPFSFAALIALIVGLVLMFVLVAVLIFKPAVLFNLLSNDNPPVIAVITATPTPTTVALDATSTPAPIESTLAPSATPTDSATTAPAATETLPPIDTATPPPPTATETALPTQAPVSSPTVVPPGPDRAEFVQDVTVPDGTTFTEGSEFTKTWRIKNVGTSTWTTEYVFEFAGGDPMPQVTRLALPNNVAPGETIDLSIPMKVPTGLGKKTSLFQLRNAANTTFGVGPQYNEFIYVEILVVANDTSATSPAP